MIIFIPAALKHTEKKYPHIDYIGIYGENREFVGSILRYANRVWYQHTMQASRVVLMDWGMVRHLHLIGVWDPIKLWVGSAEYMVQAAYLCID